MRGLTKNEFKTEMIFDD